MLASVTTKNCNGLPLRGLRGRRASEVGLEDENTGGEDIEGEQGAKHVDLRERINSLERRVESVRKRRPSLDCHKPSVIVVVGGALKSVLGSDMAKCNFK